MTKGEIVGRVENLADCLADGVPADIVASDLRRFAEAIRRDLPAEKSKGEDPDPVNGGDHEKHITINLSREGVYRDPRPIYFPVDLLLNDLPPGYSLTLRKDPAS